jgi:purine-binding chemotaxis protein CheW
MNMATHNPISEASAANTMLVTMRVDKQLFGIPVHQVRDVLKEYKMAPVPLAAPEISGSINLRGRIATVINLRKRLNMAAKQDATQQMFVVVEHHGQLYSLVVDSVGEVLTIPTSQIEKTPANLEPQWREAASGVCRLSNELLLLIDTQSLFAPK